MAEPGMMFPDSKNVIFIHIDCRPNFSDKHAGMLGLYGVKFGRQ